MSGIIRANAVKQILVFIGENELHNFNSLSLKTQNVLRRRLGQDIETEINTALSVLRAMTAV